MSLMLMMLYFGLGDDLLVFVNDLDGCADIRRCLIDYAVAYWWQRCCREG